MMHGFNLDDPRDLQDAAHFCVGVGYALRGKKEHEVMTFDQLTRSVDEHGTKFISFDPDFFKNHSGKYSKSERNSGRFIYQVLVYTFEVKNGGGGHGNF